MNQTVCDGAIKVRLVRQPNQALALVVDSTSGESSHFPTDLALMKSVAGGFTYQVAFEGASLTLRQDVDSVLFVYARPGSPSRQCRIAVVDYLACLDNASQS
jgi:hypothetical protein